MTPFVKAKDLLVEIADRLSAEATALGDTSLSTKLSDFKDEMDNNTAITDKEFFNSSDTAIDLDSVAVTWSAILDAASNYMKTKNLRIQKEHIEVIKDNTTTIAQKQTTIAENQTIIATRQTTIASKQSDMRNYQLQIKNWMEHDGIHVKSPWEYIGMYSLIELFKEKGWSLPQARAIVEATLKHRD